MQTKRQAISDAGLSHGLHAQARIAREHGREVARTWLSGVLTGLAAYARLLLGAREAYQIFQECADALVVPVIDGKSE